ncbi:hypothetical protein BDZ97DRAFT_1758600 [Flammula alnicola]|nr:hypothetical protein BDZ97DRAFT_1758600 [Flammula alnicola]
MPSLHRRPHDTAGASTTTAHRPRPYEETTNTRRLLVQLVVAWRVHPQRHDDAAAMAGASTTRRRGAADSTTTTTPHQQRSRLRRVLLHSSKDEGSLSQDSDGRRRDGKAREVPGRGKPVRCVADIRKNTFSPGLPKELLGQPKRARILHGGPATADSKLPIPRWQWRLNKRQEIDWEERGGTTLVNYAHLMWMPLPIIHTWHSPSILAATACLRHHTARAWIVCGMAPLRPWVHSSTTVQRRHIQPRHHLRSSRLCCSVRGSVIRDDVPGVSNPVWCGSVTCCRGARDGFGACCWGG